MWYWLSFILLPKLTLGGASGTVSGYDTFGTDAVCWQTSNTNNGTGQILFNKEGLVDEFYTDSNLEDVTLLSACSEGTWLKVTPPPMDDPYMPLDTQKSYNYTVEGQIDLSSQQQQIVSDIGNHTILVETVLCKAGAAFCTPFINYQLSNMGVISDGILKDLEPSESMAYNFSVVVPTTVEVPGPYVVLGVATFFAGSQESGAEIRFDMANAIRVGGGNEITFLRYSHKGKINEIEIGARIIVYILIGMAAACLIIMIGLTIRYYKNQVMQMCQAPFLLAYQIVALFGVCCCIMLEPKTDTYCNWGKTLIIVALQTHIAITLGRLYRIHAVVSPLLPNHLATKSESNCLVKFRVKVLSLLVFGKWKKFKRGQQMRRKVGPERVNYIVAAWVLPQLVLQILRLSLETHYQTIDWTELYTVGRYSCTNIFDGKEYYKSFEFYSFLLLGLLGLVLFVMAYVSRNLPSLLNESNTIFKCVLVNSLVVIVCGTGINLQGNPDSSPGLRFLMFVTVVLVVIMMPTVKIVFPKLLLAMSGHEVVIHKIISEHKLKSGKKKHNKEGFNNVHVTGTSLEKPSPSTSRGVPSSSEEIEGSNEMIVVHEGEVPPLETLEKMKELQKTLLKTSEKIQMGLQVSSEDWNLLRNVTKELDSSLNLLEFKDGGASEVLEVSEQQEGLKDGVLGS